MKIFLLTTLVAGLYSAQALACSCMELPPIADEYKTSAKVALATAVHEHEYTVKDGELRALTIFAVKKTYKGDKAGFITIDESMMTSCSRSFRMESDYLLWLQPAENTSPGEWQAPPCGRTADLLHAKEDVEWLETNKR